MGGSDDWCSICRGMLGFTVESAFDKKDPVIHKNNKTGQVYWTVPGETEKMTSKEMATMVTDEGASDMYTFREMLFLKKINPKWMDDIVTIDQKGKKTKIHKSDTGSDSEWLELRWLQYNNDDEDVFIVAHANCIKLALKYLKTHRAIYENFFKLWLIDYVSMQMLRNDDKTNSPIMKSLTMHVFGFAHNLEYQSHWEVSANIEETKSHLEIYANPLGLNRESRKNHQRINGILSRLVKLQVHSKDYEQFSMDEKLKQKEISRVRRLTSRKNPDHHRTDTNSCIIL